MRNLYWDKALVCDNELTEDFLQSIEFTYKNVPLKDGTVWYTDGRTASPSIYKCSDQEDGLNSFIYKKIYEMGLVPILPDTTPKVIIKKQQLPVGGFIEQHDDQNNSIAVTLYLSTPDGGELKIYSGDDQDLLIKPKRGRIVVVKAGTRHEVLPVTSGVRDSIQLFIRYEK